MTGIDPELLERLRRGVPLRMNAQGALLFDDEPVTHPRVQRALREGLDLSDTGEPMVRLGAQWCYLTIEDCPLRARALHREDDGTLMVRLDDGRTIALDPTTLWDEPDHGLRATVPSSTSGRPLAVRFTNPAQMDLAQWLHETDDGAMVLVFDDDRIPIPTVAPMDQD